MLGKALAGINDAWQVRGCWRQCCTPANFCESPTKIRASELSGAAQTYEAFFSKLQIVALFLAALLLAIIFAIDYAVGRDFDLQLL